jgi:hypothetical protein
MNRATLVVYNTGLFYDELKKWDAIPTAHQTYEAFCEHIREAQQVYCRQQRTSKQSGQASHSGDPQHGREFANTAAIDRTEKAAIDSAQQDLIKALTMQVDMLTKQNQEILARLNLPLTNFSTIPATGAPSNSAPQQLKRVPVDEGSYCWSHGYLMTKNHASLNCNFPKDGHQKGVTRANNMGGSQVGKLSA